MLNVLYTLDPYFNRTSFIKLLQIIHNVKIKERTCHISLDILFKTKQKQNSSHHKNNNQY